MAADWGLDVAGSGGTGSEEAGSEEAGSEEAGSGGTGSEVQNGGAAAVNVTGTGAGPELGRGPAAAEACHLRRRLAEWRAGTAGQCWRSTSGRRFPAPALSSSPTAP